MAKYVFVGRKKDRQDRDACFYLREKEEKTYDGHIIFSGPCFSGWWEDIKEVAESGEFESYLTQEELLDLINGNNYDYYIEKLQSLEAKEFQDEIIEDEKDWLMDEYYLSQEDVDHIFEEYTLDYRDRGIVSCVYDNLEDLGYEEAHNYGIIPNGDPHNVEKYFDFEAFGEDLVYESDCYIELPSGKCVYLNY